MKKLSFLLGITLASLLAVGCSKTVNHDKTPQQSETTIKQPSTSTDDSEWSFYKNSKFGFSLNYPSDWILEEHNESGSFILLPKAFAEHERDNMISIQAINVGRETVFDTSNKIGTGTFAGKKALSYDCPQTVECYGDLAYQVSYKLTEMPKLWTKNNEIDATVMKAHSELIPVFKTILSSLTFSQ